MAVASTVLHSPRFVFDHELSPRRALGPLLDNIFCWLDQIPTTLEAEGQAVRSWLGSACRTPQALLHAQAVSRCPVECPSWLLTLPEFRSWEDLNGPISSPRLLWLSGPPGAGKTVLASALIRRACTNGSTAVAYYYFVRSRYRDESASFLSWIVWRLCRQAKFSPTASDLPGHVPSPAVPRAPPSVSTLLQALRLVLGHLQHAFLFIDGVDECVERAQLLSLLRRLASDPAFSRLRIIVASRCYVDITDTLADVSVPINIQHWQVAASTEATNETVAAPQPG